MAFEGYLLKATANNTVFPHKYMELASYTTTPNSREEIKANRDDYTRNLTRVTAGGTKTAISFKSKPMNLAEKQALQNWFTSAETDHLQRKIQLTYWNDEDNTYQTGYFYRADMQFTIKRIDGNNIYYDGVEINLIEY